MQFENFIPSEDESRFRECREALSQAGPTDYCSLAAMLMTRWRDAPPACVGLSGGQGSGKTTLGGFLTLAGEFYGLRVCVLSLDDFYLPRSERLELAERVHALFATRGVPGTHDMGLCRSVIDSLGRAGGVDIPCFDKGMDDRSGSIRLEGPFDIVVLEGWCVGANAVSETALEPAINSLEAQRDSKAIWRQAVNRALVKHYEPVWDSLAERLHLQVPSLDSVRRWRLQQEQNVPEELRMDAIAIEQFVDHYERITRRMQASVGGESVWIAELNEDHRIRDLRPPTHF